MSVERIFVKALQKTPLPILGLPALQRAQQLLTLACTGSITELRSSKDPVVTAQGKIEEQNISAEHASGNRTSAVLRPCGTCAIPICAPRVALRNETCCTCHTTSVCLGTRRWKRG